MKRLLNGSRIVRLVNLSPCERDDILSDWRLGLQ